MSELNVCRSTRSKKYLCKRCCHWKEANYINSLFCFPFFFSDLVLRPGVSYWICHLLCFLKSNQKTTQRYEAALYGLLTVIMFEGLHVCIMSLL